MGYAWTMRHTHTVSLSLSLSVFTAVFLTALDAQQVALGLNINSDHGCPTVYYDA
jgi:hypothetical protein